ncbi:sortase family protein, LPXTG-site transpeptidase [Corynebacterium mustelae]|uniref:Sortase family protein, LPXTG-site transpeptidase n=2 Tax=Corynebacterium mustelae TaxID=571915 RepID=A0A0G3GTH7_9CORY|nr:sortase family protein, LPXTG-site transpeptidase [Corynebacterium mustelae]
MHTIMTSPKAQPSAFRRIVLPALVIIVGIAVLVYPVAATQWNNYKQLRVAEQYSTLERDKDPIVLNEMVAAAHEYNQNRATGPILDPWLARITPDNTDYQEYLHQLDAFDVMARLVIPSVNIDLPVFHGTTEEVLHKGVGHLFGSDLPIGGESTHSVLTGHTGLSVATLFDNLADVKIGDAIYVAVAGQRLKYEIHDMQVVLPDQTDSLNKQEGKDLLTLITCTPYGVNSHRILVTAHQVPMNAADEHALNGSGMNIQWWMWLFGLSAVCAAALLLSWIMVMVRRSRPKINGEQP